MFILFYKWLNEKISSPTGKHFSFRITMSTIVSFFLYSIWCVSVSLLWDDISILFWFSFPYDLLYRVFFIPVGHLYVFFEFSVHCSFFPFLDRVNSFFLNLSDEWKTNIFFQSVGYLLILIIVSSIIQILLDFDIISCFCLSLPLFAWSMALNHWWYHLICYLKEFYLCFSQYNLWN